MKPSNPIYVGGPLSDPPDEPVMIQCRDCKCLTDAKVWRARHGHCPKCGAWNTAIPNED